jgi:hypothetical protein
MFDLPSPLYWIGHDLAELFMWHLYDIPWFLEPVYLFRKQIAVHKSIVIEKGHFKSDIQMILFFCFALNF